MGSILVDDLQEEDLRDHSVETGLVHDVVQECAVFGLRENELGEGSAVRLFEVFVQFL